MRKSATSIVSLFVPLFLISTAVPSRAQTKVDETDSTTVNVQTMRTVFEEIDRQFARDIAAGDSAAVAAHYTKDARLGSLHGNEILSFWGRYIRRSKEQNTRNIRYIITGLSGDGEYFVELGRYEILDNSDTVLSKGKYVVVWKQENGEWKIYRDIGL